MTAALSAELIKAPKIEEVMNVLSKPACVRVYMLQWEKESKWKVEVVWAEGENEAAEMWEYQVCSRNVCVCVCVWVSASVGACGSGDQ